MKTNKQQSLKNREKVLAALSALPLHELTPDEILVALKQEGVASLKDLVTKLNELKGDFGDLSSPSPSRINLQLLFETDTQGEDCGHCSSGAQSAFHRERH